MNCIEKAATLYPSLNDTLYRKDNLIFEKKTFMGESLSFRLFLLDDVQRKGGSFTSDFSSFDIVDFNTIRRELF